MILPLKVFSKKIEYPGKIRFAHKQDTDHSNCFSQNEDVLVYVFLPRIMSLESTFISLKSSEEQGNEYVVSGKWFSLENGMDVYSYRLPRGTAAVGIYYGQVVVNCKDSTYYSSGSFDDVTFTPDEHNASKLQLTLYNDQGNHPENLYGGIIYHIFVDRFFRAGKSVYREGSIVCNDEWLKIPEYPEYSGAPLKNNIFYGGDLDGIISKLGYISSLGVTHLYLSPIFESPSNHRYDTADYESVDTLLGGDDALLRLICAADKQGIKIILDGVFNHTGADSKYFNKFGKHNTLGAYQSKDSEYFDWFEFKSFPDNYTCWWNIDILPRINPSVPSCRRYFTGNGGIIEKYRKIGIYGLRLDVADELSDDFISEIKSVLSADGESVLYGEVWEDASNKIAYGKRKKYYLGGELDGVMNYPLRKGLIEYLVNGSIHELKYALTDVYLNAPKAVSDCQMNILGTHDTERILTVLGGSPKSGSPNSELVSSKLEDSERNKAKRLLRSAYTILSTLPGIPAIFYGDEAGLEGYGDPFNRLPYPWGKEDHELLDHYRAVGALRRRTLAYKNGEFRIHCLTSELLVFSRISRGAAYVTVFNNSDSAIKIDSEVPFYEFGSQKKIYETRLGCKEATVLKIKDQQNIRIKKD